MPLKYLILGAVTCVLSEQAAFPAADEDFRIVLNPQDEEVTYKRDISIVGPIPSNFRGQASGQTTFDGVVSKDLHLPLFESSDVPQNSSPDVNIFDGQQGLTYDGLLSTDLALPLPHISVVNNNRGPQAFDVRTSVAQPLPIDIRLQSTPSQQLHEFSKEPISVGNLQGTLIKEESIFPPLTLNEQHHVVLGQYVETLKDYQTSLYQFKDELNKYSSQSKS